jgi:uncharacterized integral membrane protein
LIFHQKCCGALEQSLPGVPIKAEEKIMSAVKETSISSKKPWLAGILNVIIPGLGHIYLKNYRRGFATFFITIILLFMGTYKGFVITTAEVTFSTSPIVCIGGMFIILVGALFWDGYKAAQKHNSLLQP